MSDFAYTTAIRKLRKLTKRIKCIPGGSSAGKTFGILPILIDKAARTPRLEISVVSETIPHLRRGAMKDFIKIMQATNRYIDANWNRTLLKYNFSNGSYIEFFSADQEENVRGPRRHILYVNEANNINFETYHQLAIRTRDEIWLDWNPSVEFWAYTELMHDDDAEWLTLTYKDNDALSPSIIKEIEKAKKKAETSKYWENWWLVYGLGQLGMLEGVVFDNWDQISNIPADARLIGRGLDFGYSNDPTAVADVYKWNDYRILDERCYQTKLVNSAIAAVLDNDVPIYADSAEPKSIDEIRNCGIHRIEPTKKGTDSINYGIQLMQGQRYLVTARSTNLIKELRGYCWDKDKNGVTLNKPCGLDHLIDAVRYHEMMTLAQPASWSKIWA
ncbi:MAG: phage terminase large subunit [Niabella sp.]|nr:phage terminase large subunit [Niabella sp.]